MTGLPQMFAALAVGLLVLTAAQTSSALVGWRGRWLLQSEATGALHDAPLATMAAELARLSARLAEMAARHTAHRGGHRGAGYLLSATLPAPSPAVTPSAKINTGVVQSVDLSFKAQNITIVGLKNDEFVSGYMFRHRAPFGHELLGKLMDLVSPGDTVVDAGANLGTYSVFLAAKVGPSGRVFSFEPQARMFQMLCTNMIVNSLLQMQPKNMALSYKAGVLQMMSQVTDGSSANKPIADVEKQQGRINYGGMRLGVGGEEVATRTLDSFNLTGVTLMKVDVQWAEKLMFYGARDTITRNLPVIAYETIMPQIADDLERELAVPEFVKTFNITEFLIGLGYKPYPGFSTIEDTVMLPPGHQILQLKP